MRTSSRWTLGLFALFMSACGGVSAHVDHPEASGPPAVDAENEQEIRRVVVRMDPTDPERVAWRDALVEYLARDSGALITRGDYDAVVAQLAELTSLMTPAELERGQVPEAVEPLANFIIEHGSPRGDEGRVMGAHLLLSALGRDVETHRDARAEIAAWGRAARSGISSPLERFGGLIRVWEQQDQIAASPEVLEMLARLYLEQRGAIASLFDPEAGSVRGRFSPMELRMAPLLMQRAPLDVAAVFLRHEDLEGAIEHVGQFSQTGEDGPLVVRLAEILSAARENTPRGADALGELAEGFSNARPEITAAICRLGARRFPEEARFALCLARAAAQGDRSSEAVSWYAEAVRLAPAERDVYTAALQQLAELMEAGAFESEIGQSRSLARSARSILVQYERRWPDAEPPIRRSQILLQLARAEMSAGHVAQAREQLEASLEAEDAAPAHMQLGLLLERVGEPTLAAQHYRAALDQTPSRTPPERAERALLTERLGDALRDADETQQARRMYRQALALWDALAEQMSGPRVAIAHVRRGVLLSGIGDTAASAQAFEAALAAHPSWREPYTAILAHLMVSEPNPELAQRVLNRARYQLHLDPRWKVYFILWVQSIVGRASAELEPELSALLGELAQTDGWAGRLAAFANQTLSYPELRERATNVGERVEADFYEGTRRLTGGDEAGARALFQQVMESGLVNFYEYGMSQEMLRRLPAANAATSSASNP